MFIHRALIHPGSTLLHLFRNSFRTGHKAFCSLHLEVKGNLWQAIPFTEGKYMAPGHNLWLHFWVDEHPLATYVDVHQGYRVLTHSHIEPLAL